MSYLYGDSTPSPLKSNFIQFLGEALDFSVHVLQAAARLQALAQRRAGAKEHAEGEAARLEALRTAVIAAVDRAPKGAAESPAFTCGKAIIASAHDLVGRSAGQAATTLANEVAALQLQEAQEREGCERALEALLRAHDPPGATATVHFVHDGTHYKATRRVQTPFGLEGLMELDVAAPHPLSQVARVDKFVAHLEIQAPESGGWLRKEVKNRPQRLEKHYLTEMTFGPGTSTLRMRAGVDETHGFDAEIRDEAPRVKMWRVGPADEGANGAFDVSEEDAQKVLELHGKLRAAAFDAATNRTKLLEATLDQHAFAQLPDPALVVERLVGAMAPVVQEIAAHSLAPGELILKKVVGDHRREEIFVSKAALEEKIAGVAQGQRAVFGALGLSAGFSRVPPPAPSHPRSVTPAPSPSKPKALELVADEAESESKVIVADFEEEDVMPGSRRPSVPPA